MSFCNEHGKLASADWAGGMIAGVRGFSVGVGVCISAIDLRGSILIGKRDCIEHMSFCNEHGKLASADWAGGMIAGVRGFSVGVGVCISAIDLRGSILIGKRDCIERTFSCNN